MRKVLIIGGQGYLGRQLFAQAPLGLELASLSRSHACAKQKHFTADIRNKQALLDLVSQWQPSWILNCAALGVQFGAASDSWESMHALNCLAAKNVADIAHRCPSVEKLFHIGSCFEYGHIEGAIHEGMTTRPTSFYGKSKAAGTEAVLSSAGTSKLCVARVFSLWGEDEPAHRIFPSVVAANANASVLALTDCRQLRDYIHVKDAARTLWQILEDPRFGRDPIVNIAAGDHRSLREYVESLHQITGGAGTINFGARAQRPDEMMSLLADKALLDTYQVDKPCPFEAHASALVGC